MTTQTKFVVCQLDFWYYTVTFQNILNLSLLTLL